MCRRVIVFGRRRVCSGVVRRVGIVFWRRRLVGRLLLSRRDVVVYW